MEDATVDFDAHRIIVVGKTTRELPLLPLWDKLRDFYCRIPVD